MKKPSPASQLDGFIAKFTPEIGAMARSVLDRMRELLPGAIEMVYDNYNALVIGFGQEERPSDAVFSVVVYPDHVSVCFIWGAKLPDPQKRLKGGGKQVRHIRLTSADDLDIPGVRDLIAVANQRAKVPIDGRGDRKLVIRAISAKQRPRRPKRTV